MIPARYRLALVGTLGSALTLAAVVLPGAALAQTPQTDNTPQVHRGPGGPPLAGAHGNTRTAQGQRRHAPSARRGQHSGRRTPGGSGR